MKMTINEAIKIVDPETTWLEIGLYSSENSMKAYHKACKLVVDELRKWQWISVEDRLPEDKQRVLVYSPFNVGSDVGPIAVQSGWMCKNKNHGITHWMPLPEPPEAGDKNA